MVFTYMRILAVKSIITKLKTTAVRYRVRQEEGQTDFSRKVNQNRNR